MRNSIKVTIQGIVDFIQEYIESSGAKGVVVGMSGGKDSFITAKLCTMAIGKENVLGVIMPDGKMKDINIAKEECECVDIKYKVVDINKFTKNIKKAQKMH